jgi:LPS export ABC transporter protein LptC
MNGHCKLQTANCKLQTLHFAFCTLHFALTLSLLLLLGGCKQRGATRIESVDLPDQIIDGFRLTQTEAGRPVYDLDADKAYVYIDSNRIDVTRPSIRFFDSTGAVTSTLTADSGWVQSKTSDLVARSNVHVATRDSTYLNTDSLAWRNARQVIVTDAPVTIRSPQGSISGIGLTSDPGLRRVEIKQTVQATTQYEFGQ